MNDLQKLVCSHCGGHNVEVKAWIDANTSEYRGIAEDDDDYWCEDCEKHYELITLEEYLFNQKKL